MGIGFINDISIKKTDKERYLSDDDTGVKPKHLSQRGMEYTYYCKPIHQFWDRDRKIAR